MTIENDLRTMYEYLIGVDGGGTGTRVCIEHVDGAVLGYGCAGPSGLAHGIDAAWQAILVAVDRAFAEAGMQRPPLASSAIGIGLAGVSNKQWAIEFAGKNPGFGATEIETDAFTTLLGAHDGQPGAIIAMGTGSVGEIWLPGGERRTVGGWGFPSSDEASGAWLGLQAVNHLQRVLDGRARDSDFARAILASCGSDRDGFRAWLGGATQTIYARLAPVVISHADSDDAARGIMNMAGQEIADIAAALDPSGSLPIALCGGLAEPLRAYLPDQLLGRMLRPRADSTAGALRLIRRRFEGK